MTHFLASEISLPNENIYPVIQEADMGDAEEKSGSNEVWQAEAWRW